MKAVCASVCVWREGGVLYIFFPERSAKAMHSSFLKGRKKKERETTIASQYLS